MKFRLLILFIISIGLSGQDWGKITQTNESDAEALEQQNLMLNELEPLVLEVRVSPENYIVGPGDVFQISIETTENFLFQVPVGPTGEILIPYVGVISLNALNLNDAVDQISTRCKETFNISTVHVSLIQIRQFRVPVTGAVLEPGLKTVSAMMRLSDVLEIAQVSPLAREFEISIERDGSLIRYDIIKYYSRGEIEQNPVLSQGDRVHVPFGDIATEGILVQGSVEQPGFDIIRPDEILSEYVQRKVLFNEEIDVESIKIIRKTDSKVETLSLPPSDFGEVELMAGDQVEFLSLKPVSVIGYVGNPGSYRFIPGLTSGDYVARAGGISSAGTTVGISTSRSDGSVVRGEDTLIQRGDVIEVKRSLLHIILGESSAIQFVATLSTIALAFLAVN